MEKKDPDQEELRGLEAAMAGHLGGHSRLNIHQEKELRERIREVRNRIFNKKQSCEK